MEEKKMMYFGHPINTYNTLMEEKAIAILGILFPEYEIENPNQPHHQEGYQRYNKTHGRGMTYYEEEVLINMSAGAFLTFDDGMLGAGVYFEAEDINENGNPIFEINLEGVVVELVLDKSRKLSVPETKKRVYPDK
jgi:hypothetical protein